MSQLRQYLQVQEATINSRIYLQVVGCSRILPLDTCFELVVHTILCFYSLYNWFVVFAICLFASTNVRSLVALTEPSLGTILANHICRELNRSRFSFQADFVEMAQNVITYV